MTQPQTIAGLMSAIIAIRRIALPLTRESADSITFRKSSIRRTIPNMTGLAAASEDFLFKQAKAYFAAEQYPTPWGCCASCTTATQSGRSSERHGVMTEKLLDQYERRRRLCLDCPCSVGWPLAIPAIRSWKNGRRGCDTRRRRSWPPAGPPSSRAIFAERPSRSSGSSACRLVESKDLALAVHRSYPRVIVGVCESAADPCGGLLGNGRELLTDWAARRSTGWFVRPWRSSPPPARGRIVLLPRRRDESGRLRTGGSSCG